jgi:CDP-glucose 4,6-dehydratase
MDFTWENKSVLITGISGFLGAHLAEILTNKGAHVVGIVHDLKKNNYLGIKGLDKRIDVCQANILNHNRMREIITNYDIKYIFHCAAESIVQKCTVDPLGVFNTNIMGTVSLLEAARVVGGVEGIMCMESDKTYGSFDSKDLPYKEDQAIKPTNVYEVSKACTGLVAHAYSNNYSLPIFTIRGANLYGPGDMSISRLIPGSIMRVLRGEPPIVYSGVADYIREFIYVEDAANAIIQLMEKIDKTKLHAINLGSGYKYNIKSIVELICSMLNTDYKPKIIEKDPVFKEIEEQYLDLTKLKSFLPDFEPRELHEGLKKTISWYKELYDKKLLS